MVVKISHSFRERKRKCKTNQRRRGVCGCKNRVCKKIVCQKPLITPEKFGRLLREWRKARGLNQLAACIALDLPRDQALISNWENAKSMPRKLRPLRALAIITEAAQ